MIDKNLPNVNPQQSLLQFLQRKPKGLKSWIVILILVLSFIGNIEIEVLTSNVKVKFHLAISPIPQFVQRVMKLL